VPNVHTAKFNKALSDSFYYKIAVKGRLIQQQEVHAGKNSQDVVLILM